MWEKIKLILENVKGQEMAKDVDRKISTEFPENILVYTGRIQD